MPYSAEANAAWYRGERELQAQGSVCEATRKALAPFEERGDPSGDGNGVLFVRRAVNGRAIRIMDLGLEQPRVLSPEDWCEQPLIGDLVQEYLWDAPSVPAEQAADEASDDPKERDLHLARCKLWREIRTTGEGHPDRDNE